MATFILDEIKQSLGIMPDNLGFDLDLLIFLNSAIVNLIQLGVTEMDITITEETAWPSFTISTVGDLVKHYLNLKSRQTFDPTASETIARTVSDSVMEVENRITHEIEENAL